MPDVVLLYERSCPNARAARANLLRAFSEANQPAEWRELDVDAPDTPPAWRALGSPTVLVDGADVCGAATAEGATCRLYSEKGKLVGAPSVDRIAARLHHGAPLDDSGVAALRCPPRSGFRAALAATPGLGIALLPNLACPACWPAYAGALSPLGLGFLTQSRYLLPLTIALLGLSTFAIAFRARTRRGYAPAVGASVAAVALVLAKFVSDSEPGTYVATSVFAGAAIWNAWPLPKASVACPSCVS